jgi:uncharacterized caspase-like protein
MKTYLIALIGLLILWSPAVYTKDSNWEIAPSASGRRVALIIGNANYSVGSLKNPVNDAKDMASTLRELGFDVIAKEDMKLREMKEVIHLFGDKILNSEVALFYYAGHGIQVNGQNYLVPIDANIKKHEDIEYECVDVGLVLAQMEEKADRTNIVILDACRNNPFARRFRDSSRGLAVLNARRGTLIAYATAPGKVASDGGLRNGLYTQELLKNMRTPGLSIEEFFKQVRIAVSTQTQGEQIPWELSSLTIPFSFKIELEKSQPSSTVTSGTASQDMNPTITIIEPIQGSSVEQIITAKGSAANVPEGSIKWIYVFPTDERKYYLTEITNELSDGSWDAIIYIGSKDDPPGSTFRIGVILADGRISQELAKKSQGIQHIPNNPKKFSEIIVKRK